MHPPKGVIPKLGAFQPSDGSRSGIRLSFSSMQRSLALSRLRWTRSMGEHCAVDVDKDGPSRGIPRPAGENAGFRDDAVWRLRETENYGLVIFSGFTS